MPPACDLLDSLPAELSQQLKDNNTPELAKFREANAQGHSKDDIEFLRNFREFVPITSYEPYQPFVAKFFATPCREVDVRDMFAPGLPCFLAMSSATSGKEPKFFARYRPPLQYAQHPIYRAVSASGGTMLAPSSLKYSKVLKIDREDSRSSQELVVCSVTSGFARMLMNWDVEHDLDRLDLWAPGKTAPYAVALIESHRPFFVLHALFALADRKVTTIYFLFANAFVGLLRYIEDEWFLLVDCIENGIIPDFDNIDHLRGALKKHFTANPARAAELREIGPPRDIEGWAVRVWPALTTFIGITGGPSAVVVPKITQILGPSVAMQSYGYGSSESSVAKPYHNGDPTVDLKVTMVNGVIEFVDVRSDEHVLSVWELEKGQHYQPILTTRSGLWRYRLGDVVSFKGFAPDDGMPIINYIHRQDGTTVGAMCTESDLTNAIISIAHQWIGQITGFTVVCNEQQLPFTYVFLEEIEGIIGKDAKMASQQLSEVLMASSAGYRRGFWWRCDKAGISIAQVKVPVIVSDDTSKEWFMSKVVLKF